MKTLANCAPVEFLRQTNQIRHFAAGLFKKAGIKEIRARQPEFTGEENPEERKEKLDAQASQNLSDMLDALLETDAEGTVKLLGMMCFMTPEEALKANGLNLFGTAMDLLNCKPVIDFLMTCARLAR